MAHRLSHFLFHGMLELRRGINRLKDFTSQATLGAKIFTTAVVNDQSSGQHQGIQAEEIDHYHGSIFLELHISTVLSIAELLQTEECSPARNRQTGLTVMRTETFRLGRRKRQECLLTLVQFFGCHFTQTTSHTNLGFILRLVFQQEGTMFRDALRRGGYLFRRSLSRDLREDVFHGVMLHGLRGGRPVFDNQKERRRLERHTKSGLNHVVDKRLHFFKRGWSHKKQIRKQTVSTGAITFHIVLAIQRDFSESSLLTSRHGRNRGWIHRHIGRYKRRE
mmetsp:Transcript_7945/g.15433  ORF Transcript_7945/g.15433 Transcript_7945/m.15433 type:complete len:278 (-) Transcript_7945:96-929(-)